jgi:hypothetical protein
VTITVEAGLGGALKAIRDALRDRNGAFNAANGRLENEKRDIADDKAALETRSEVYYNQLLKTFTGDGAAGLRLQGDADLSRAASEDVDQRPRLKPAALISEIGRRG